jgi:hypothetical protein
VTLGATVTYSEHDLRRYPLFREDYRGVASMLIAGGWEATLSGDGVVSTNAPREHVMNAIALHVDTSGT